MPQHAEPIWKTMPEYTPADQEVVWLRRSWWSHAFLATWDVASQTFQAAASLVLPWWIPSRWRHQPTWPYT